MKSIYQKAPVADNYKYLGWLLAGKLAEWLGMEVGITQSEDGEKCAIVIELPSGQIHRVLPTEVMEGNWKQFDQTKFQERSWKDETKSIEDCLNGVLVSKHVLLIPQQKEVE